MAQSFAESKSAYNANSTNTTSTAAYVLTSSIVTEEAYTLCEDGRYQIYENYVDEDYSTVDNLKNITTDGKQINMTQEENSQVILHVVFVILRIEQPLPLMQLNVDLMELMLRQVLNQTK